MESTLEEKLMKKSKNFSRRQTILMAYQTLGVVYGDLGTSSLYVFSPTNIRNPDEDDILGIFSLIFWGLTLIGLIKYAFIVLQADDNGEGGTFAVYSLLCRHLNLSQESTNLQLDEYQLAHQPKGTVQRFARNLLEENRTVQKFLLIFVMVGTSMVIGDGVLNPAISGVVVIWVMLMTTFLVALVMIVIWNIHFLLVLAFLLVFGFVEGVFMVAAMDKVSKGGWVPFGISAFLLVIMISWYHGRQKKHKYELENKMSVDNLSAFLSTERIHRPQGICFFYTSHTHDLPPIFLHYIKTVNSLHRVVIMVTIKLLPVSTIPLEERFVGRILGPTGIYRCLVQYGYGDELCMGGEEFLNGVIGSLKFYTRALGFQGTMGNFKNSSSKEICTHDLDVIDIAENCKTVFVIGKTTLRVSEKSTWVERMVMDYMYRFLENNSRSFLDILNISPSSFLHVGMLYEI